MSLELLAACARLPSDELAKDVSSAIDSSGAEEVGRGRANWRQTTSLTRSRGASVCVCSCLFNTNRVLGGKIFFFYFFERESIFFFPLL